MPQTKPTLGTAIRHHYLDMLDWLDQQHFPRVAIVVILLAIVSGSALVGRIQRGSIAAAVPTPSLPIIIIASPVPAVPLVAPAPAPPLAAQLPAIPRDVVAFAAPDGVALGAIPEPPTSALLGRWGDGWVATTWQGNTVWLRAADLGLNLANLEPQIAPQQPVSVSAPPAPEQPYQLDNAPQAPEQPAQHAQPVAAPVVVPAQALSPTLAPMEQNSVTQEWARQQYEMER